MALKLPTMATQIRNLGLPDRLVRAVEEVQQFLRIRSTGLDAYVSRRDLIEWGFATEPGGWSPPSGGGPIAPTLPPDFDPDIPDLTPPPTPTGVTAVGGYTSIFVKWDVVLDRRIGFFEVWRAGVNDIGEAVKIGQTTSFQYIDEVQNSDTYYYWVRSVNRWNQEIVSAFNAVDGTEATTSPDVSLALDLLIGDEPEKPFYWVPEPIVIDGIPIAAGVYIKQSFTKAAVVELFTAGLAVIDDANIKNLYVGKLIGDKLAVGQYIESQNYVSNTSGWRINADGTAEFSGVVVRGTVIASAGNLGGININEVGIRSGNFVPGTSGFTIHHDGTAEFNEVTVRGTVYATHVVAGASISAPTITGGSITSSTLNSPLIYTSTLSGGFLQGALTNNWINLNATGAQRFIQVGTSQYYGPYAGSHYQVEIGADGSAFFARNVLSGGSLLAAGTKIFLPGDQPTVYFNAGAGDDGGGSNSGP